MRFLLSVVLLLTLAANAAASTITENHGYALVYVSDGEANDLTVAWTPDGLTIDDAGSPITAAFGACRRTGSASAVCTGILGVNFQLGGPGQGDQVRKRLRMTTPPGFTAGQVQISTSGGEDDIDLSGATVSSASVSAGDGADRIAGPAGIAELSGDAGNDLVIAGPAGETRFLSIAPDGADTYVAGPGTDVMDYTLREAGVRVTPGAGHDDGAPGEGDDVGDVEQVRTWAGDDVVHRRSATGGLFDGGPAGNDSLFGGPGDDVLDPGSGAAGDADVLRGGGGRDTVSYAGRANPGPSYRAYYRPVRISQNGRADDGYAGEHDNVGADVEVLEGTRNDDRISAGPAANVLLGGEGQDVIRARGGGRDRVDCGGGYDLAIVDARDIVDPSCEVVKTG